MLGVISFILEETMKGDKKKRITGIKLVNFLQNIWYLSSCTRLQQDFFYQLQT